MERTQSIDFVKGMAIFIVVAFHVMTFDGIYIRGSEIWLYVFPRFIIPFFFIVAGFLFGHKMKSHSSSDSYFKKYLFTLIAFFIGWHVLYIIYDIFIRVLYGVYKGEGLKTELANYINLMPKLSTIYYGIGVTSYHLWYLTALIWSIGVVFLFVRWKKLKLLLIVGLLFNLVGLFGQSYSGILTLPIDTRDALFFGLFYTSLGCYAAFNYERLKCFIGKIKSRTLIVVFIFSTFIQVLESFVTVNLYNGTMAGAGYYLSTIPMTISLFLLLLKNNNFGERSIFSKLGRNVFGVYLGHMLFISGFVLILHFFDLAWLRNFFIINLIFTVLIIISSHIFFVFIQGVVLKVYMNFKRTLLFQSKERKTGTLIKRRYEL